MFGQIPLIGTSGVQAEDRVTYMTIDEFPMFYLMNIDRQSRFRQPTAMSRYKAYL